MYVGRFAPTPSGPLHFGSLYTAVASFLDARAAGGRWLLRIDDLDPPRCVDGAEQRIVDALDQHGLHWDGPVQRASDRQPDYDQAIAQLDADERLFYCRCPRKSLPKGPYPGMCRAHTHPRDDSAIRLRIGDEQISFVDRASGLISEQPSTTCGDLIVRRRDGLISYQLAVVVDDAATGVTDIVRGADLLTQTARQIYVAQALGLKPQRYLHLPTIDNQRGQKLSKQAHAAAVSTATPALNLCWVLDLLGLPLPRQAARWSPQDLLSHGIEAWRDSDASALAAAQFIGF